jgi:glycerol kinase
MSVLVLDVGTSSVRAAVVRPDGAIAVRHQRRFPPDRPFAGLVEFDARAMASLALDLARAALAEAGPVDGVGITNQRASTIVWDAATGEPVGPALGWQDLRTVGECLTLQADGVRVAPNASATKAAHLLNGADRGRDLRFGTVDTWIVWQLTDGACHVTDLSNAGVTGLLLLDGSDWDLPLCERLGIPPSALPAIVDSTGLVAESSALPGAPPIAGIAGDQQASLVGQSCVERGLVKATFGTGGMVDACVGETRPAFPTRGDTGCFPIAAWRADATTMWGVEGIMLSAGSCVEWLRDDLGVIGSIDESHALAASCDDSDGVVFVPSLLGMGTPYWDHGARGALLGLSLGGGRASIARAVLEGVAHRGADLVEAVGADAGLTIERLRVDGGMTANATFVQALADASQRVIEVSPVIEGTTVGAAYLAGMAVGQWSGWDDIAGMWSPRAIVEPAKVLDRERWTDAVERARGWYPELSALDF